MTARLLVASVVLGAEAGYQGECAPPLTSFGDQGCFYKCESDFSMPVKEPWRKGLALDDTTLHWCPENALFHWPNSDEPVTSFRMFKAWASHWDEPWTSKENAWRSLANHLRVSNGQVLVGTQISCSEEEDDADWENVKAMAKIFGPDRIMGLAIGNELELLWTKGSILGEEVLAECLDRVWIQGYFLNKFHSRVKEFDALGEGFDQVKITSVFGGFILAEPGWPFYDRTDKNIARVGPFIENVTQQFGDRYAHTVNIYPYFEDFFIDYDDANVEPPTCNGAIDQCTRLSSNADWSIEFGKEQSNLAWSVGRVRQRLDLGLGNKDSLLWIGETGWSYPRADTLDTKMKWCPDWHTQETFSKFYTNFLDWDLTMPGQYRGPDHVFYFTMRDSSNFGKTEGFGLVGDGDPQMWCVNSTCKIQQSPWSQSDSAFSLV